MRKNNEKSQNNGLNVHVNLDEYSLICVGRLTGNSIAKRVESHKRKIDHVSSSKASSGIRRLKKVG